MRRELETDILCLWHSNQEVREKLPKDKRLIVKLEDGLGWDEICPFLNKPIPDVKYPRGNAPAEFKALGDRIVAPRIQRALAIYASTIIVPLAAGAFYFFRWRR
jgi:hypothetical protein